MNSIKKFLKGLKIVPKTTLESDEKGELEVDNTSGKLNFHNGTTRSPVVTEDHSATIVNKSIDADNNPITNLETDNLKSGVLNVDVALTGATDTQIPSALAVKTLIENGLAAQNEASEITLVPTGTIEATNLQDAVAELDGDIQDHITDTVDAHDATAVSYDGTASGLVATEVQGAIDEVEARVDAVETSSGNTATDLSNHINNTTDAHDASAISNVPAGTIAATDVQAAINELDGDIQDHVTASTDVHGIGATASVVGTDTTQTLTNKTIQGASIETPIRSDVKQDTKANLETYALTATNGQLVFATDTKEMFQVVDTLLVPVGAGGGVGGVDILFVQTFEEAALSDFTQVGLVLDETDPLAGEVSAQLVHDASVNQSFKEVRAVDEKFRNKNITLKLNIKSAASAGNVTLTVVDETNAVTLVNSEQLPVSNDVGGAIGQVSFDMPDDCLSFSYEVVALPEAGSPVTIVDDVIAEITSLIDEQSVLVQEADSSVRLGVANGYGSTGTRIRRFSSIIENLGSDVTYIQDAVNGDRFVINTEGVYDISYYDNFTAIDNLGISLNASSLTTPIQSLAQNERLVAERIESANASSVSCQPYLRVGDIIRAHTGVGTAASTNALTGFTITKQGSLKQINPNPNSKITIPTSELRMEGASTRGSTATAIVRFDNIAKIRGDAFEVLSDATLGTRIVMKKKGKLDVSASLVLFSSSQVVGFSKNQTSLTTDPTVASQFICTNSQASAGVTVNVAGELDVNVGDVIRVFSTSVITGNLSNTMSLYFQEQDISVSVTNTLPQFSESDSSVRVDTANGYGSTGTRIRRFSNVRDNIGNDIEYVPSAVNGDSFVVKSAGIYHISYSDSNSSANGHIGITLNSTNLATNLSTLLGNPNNEVLAAQDRASTGSSNFTANASWQGYLQTGDIIRAHTDAGTVPSNNLVKFTISKVGKPNVTGVDVTPFVNIPQQEQQYITLNFGSGTAGNNITNWQVGKNTSNGLLSYSAGIITVLKKCDIDLSFYTNTTANNGDLYPAIIKNGSVFLTVNTFSSAIASANYTALPLTARDSFDVGDTIAFRTINNPNVNSRAFITATAASDSIITANESFSTDTANLVYAPSSLYTLATLNTAPVGTFITFTYAGSSNTLVQTTSRPTQTDADMNVNGINVQARASFASGTGSNIPAVIYMQIGKGLKGYTPTLFKDTTRTAVASLDWTVLVGDGVIYGARDKEYNPDTGIFAFNIGYGYGSSIVSGTNLFYNDGTTTQSGYLKLTASKSPALTGVPLVQPRIATIKDVKPSGTSGGTFTAGSFVTRVLNTVEDPTGIVTSLASNQFTLPAGEYYIEAKAPAYYVAGHKARLRNITDGTDAIVGRNASAEASSGMGTITDAEVVGRLVITTPKTFELQHRCVITRSPDGFGLPNNMSINEVFATVKITKVK